MKQLNIYEEASRCLLCQDAPCSKACKTGDPARAIRAIRFDNPKPALRWVKDCSDADLEAAEKACIHYGMPIRIKDMLRAVPNDEVDASNYPSLDIDFCGIHCENPFFLAGGLDAGNVPEVIRQVQKDATLLPNFYGVDVSGGIETDGVKDPIKMEAFMKTIRG